MTETTTLAEYQLVSDHPVLRPKESFEGFFRREYRAVLGLAVVLTGDIAAAEDITQDAFTVTFRDWDRVSTLESPEGWVRRIAANRSVSRFRRGVSEVKAILKLARQPMGLHELGNEVSLDLWREVRRLPRRQSQAIALTYLLDQPRQQVAQILGCSEETVKTHLERGRRALAQRLGVNWREGP